VTVILIFIEITACNFSGNKSSLEEEMTRLILEGASDDDEEPLVNEKRLPVPSKRALDAAEDSVGQSSKSFKVISFTLILNCIENQISQKSNIGGISMINVEIDL
jgi:hypothetical protein